MIDFRREVARLRAIGEALALANVLSVKRSAPRGLGARVADFSDGRILGTVGGGSPEAEVREAARAVLREGRARIVHHDLTVDIAAATGAIGWGTIEVSVERL